MLLRGFVFLALAAVLSFITLVGYVISLYGSIFWLIFAPYFGAAAVIFTLAGFEALRRNPRKQPPTSA